MWRNRDIYLMILPVVAYFLIFRYWAMAWISIAFYDFKLLRGFAGSTFIGLKNFADFFTGISFWQTISNTVILNVYSLTFLFPQGIIFAILLNEIRHAKVKRTIQTISYLPYFISTVVLVGMITSLLSPSAGLFGVIARSFGQEPIYFLGNPKYFRAINVLSGIWQMTGWNAIIYLSAITTIDSQLYEAATVDGAGRIRRIFHITLPGIRHTIVILFILQIGNLLGANFEKVLLLQNDLNISVSELLPTYVYKIGLVRGRYSFSTAVGLFNSIVSLLLVLVGNWVAKKVSDTETGLF
jgi:putative aldouronate transport system permease protein